MPTDLEERVYKVELALFGFEGGNGLRSEVRMLRKELREWREEEERRREVTEKQTRADVIAAKRESARNRLTVIAIAVTAFAAIITAVLTVAQGV